MGLHFPAAMHKQNFTRIIRKIFQISSIVRYFSTFLIVWVIIILFGLLAFLYTNFYKTMTDAEAIIVLRQEVATEQIKMDTYREVLEFIDQRNQTQPRDKIKNIFTKNSASDKKKEKNIQSNIEGISSSSKESTPQIQ